MKFASSHIVVEDVPRSRVFYEGVLGLGSVARRLMAGGMSLAEVSAVTYMPEEALERELAAHDAGASEGQTRP